MKNCRVPTHWLISTQVTVAGGSLPYRSAVVIGEVALLENLQSKTAPSTRPRARPCWPSPVRGHWLWEIRQFFTKSFLDDDAAVPPASPRH